MQDIGKLLVFVGIGLAVFGLILWSGVGKNFFGRLPGDIHYTKGNFSLHFPIITCIVISIVLSLLLRIFRSK